MNFLISAGTLETIAREIPPRAGTDPSLQAGYSFDIRAGGTSVFQSAATLTMEGDWPNTFVTTASVALSGIDLGGVLTHPDTGAPDRWLYAWDDFLGSVDLGVLLPGESIVLDYDARTFVTAGIDKCSTSDCAARASIGDPFNVNPDIPDDAESSIGGPDTIVSVPTTTPPQPQPPTAVFEPATLSLFGIGLAGLGLVRRKKAA